MFATKAHEDEIQKRCDMRWDEMRCEEKGWDMRHEISGE